MPPDSDGAHNRPNTDADGFDPSDDMDDGGGCTEAWEALYALRNDLDGTDPDTWPGTDE